MTEPTFILGLGGVKCGSSWVRGYLHAAPGADFGRMGEYQVWDAITLDLARRFRIATPAPLARLRGRLAQTLGLPEDVPHLRWRLQSDPSAYFDYFARLLSRPGTRLTGDVSPGYALLSTETLARIRTGFAKRGIRTRAVFIMRDPVARADSQLRMETRKGRVPADLDLASFAAQPQPDALGRYDRTLTALDQAFPPEDTHVALFEELFSNKGIAALSRFADIPPRPEAADKKANAGQPGQGIDPATARAVAHHFAPVYAALRPRFPQIDALWPSAALLPRA